MLCTHISCNQLQALKMAFCAGKHFQRWLLWQTSFLVSVSKLNLKYKNAFQWDAYRPLVDRIPACTGQGGVYPSMHWAGGVSQHALGACLPRGNGGVCRGVVDERQTPPVDRQTSVKTEPSQTSFAGSKYIRDVYCVLKQTVSYGQSAHFGQYLDQFLTDLLATFWMGIILVRQLKEVIAKWLKQSKKLAFYILPFISLISQISCAYVLEEVLNFNLMGDICEINWELDSEMSKVIAPYDYLNQGYFVNMTNWFKISLFVPFMIQGIIFYHEVGDGCFNNIIIYFVFQTCWTGTQKH